MQQCARPTSSDDPIQSVQYRVTLSAGHVLNVVKWRAPNDLASVPHVMFLHGLGDAAPVWRDVAVRLAQRAHVLAVDLRGHGDSEWIASGEYHVGAMAADIDELLHEIAVPRLALVGHSMGGAVALRVASRNPQTVERLVLADHGPDSDPEIMAEVRRALREAHRPYRAVEQYAAVLYDRHPLARRELLYWVATATSRRDASGNVQLKYDPEVLSSRGRPIAREISNGMSAETWRLLAALSCPVLVLRGAASSVLSLPVASKIANAVLRQGAYCSIPLSGHSIQLDNPDAVTRAIERFIHPADTRASVESEAGK